jgi:hypothetical protein
VRKIAGRITLVRSFQGMAQQLLYLVQDGVLHPS